MKTKVNFLQTLIIVALCFAGQTLLAASTANTISATTNRVAAQSPIACIHLREVTITPDGGKYPKGVYCLLVKGKNGSIPSIQLNEVTVSSTRIYGKESAFVEASDNDQQVVDQEVSNSTLTLETPREYVSMSTRKVYDRLLDYMVFQTKSAIRKLLPNVVGR
jgi:hypothetical protein